MKSKDVEVIPWYTADAVSCKRNAPLTQKPVSLRVEPKKTVFVGGLHGMMSASLLRKMMKDLFGPVKYVVIDTDKNRYPIGSGRVCFSENQGYQKAINAEFVEVKVRYFTLRSTDRKVGLPEPRGPIFESLISHENTVPSVFEMIKIISGNKIHKEDPN